MAGPGHEAEALQRVDHLGGPRNRDAQQPGQVREGDPGPVGHHVEGALLGGLQKDGQQVVVHVPRRPFVGDVVGGRDALRLVLYGKLSAGVGTVEDVAQVDGSADPGRAPYPVARFGQDRLALQGEQGRDLGGREQPAGVPEPHLVGHEDEHRSGHGLVAQPPEPLGEAGPVGGASLPDDADRLPIGKRHGGVHPHGAVPAEAYGEGDVGEEAGQVIYGGQGVEAFHQAAPPLGGDGAGAHQLVEGRVLFLGEPAQPGGGEVEPSRRGKRVNGVEHGGAEPARLQLLHRLVDRGPGPAGDGDHLLPVEKGHRGQDSEQVGFASFRSHCSASTSVSSPEASPVSSSPAFAESALRFPVCFPGSGPRFPSPASSWARPFSRSSTPLR